MSDIIGHYRPRDARSIEVIGRRLYKARKAADDHWPQAAIDYLLDAADDMYALLCSLATIPADEEPGDEG